MHEKSESGIDRKVASSEKIVLHGSIIIQPENVKDFIEKLPLSPGQNVMKVLSDRIQLASALGRPFENAIINGSFDSLQFGLVFKFVTDLPGEIF